MIYTRQNLIDAAIDTTMYPDIANSLNLAQIANNAVREVNSEVDLKSTKRKATAAPNLFNDIYDYACPTDMKSDRISDISPQILRGKDSDVRLTSPEEFDRKKTIDKLMVAFAENSGLRTLRIAFNIDDEELLISELDSLTGGGGTWALFGDGTNLTIDNDNFVKGTGSLNWDISAAAGLTAGVQNTGLDEFDIDDYTPAGSAFVWAYITSTTNLTNFILRIGQDSSNYFSKTITTTNEGTAFVNGWNLLRFDLQSLSETGSADETDCTYVALYMTKTAAKVSETDYRFDWLVLKRGKIHEVHYYSKYGWQSSAGTWLENSTASTDYVNAELEEFSLMIAKMKQLVAEALKNWGEADRLEKKYVGKRGEYMMRNPSDALIMITTYQEI